MTSKVVRITYHLQRHHQAGGFWHDIAWPNEEWRGPPITADEAKERLAERRLRDGNIQNVTYRILKATSEVLE